MTVTGQSYKGKCIPQLQITSLWTMWKEKDNKKKPVS